MGKEYAKGDTSGQYEKCVRCGVTVPVLRAEHVANRRYYIEGAGQLCFRCYGELYGDAGRELSYNSTRGQKQ